MTLSARDKLGPYEVVGPLGAGGMGEVYRARDQRLERDVAVKVLPEALARDPQALARFEREAKAVAAISHPNILAVYDVGRHGDVSYVVTELLEGETLRQTLQNGPMARRRALEIAIAVSDGLAAAHARGVVHRDLKPENIFITDDGVVKILDFGLARVEDPTRPADPHSAHTPTVTLYTTPGTVLGTINYMSPEQIRAQRTDARSDVFSFGCVLHEMLTGERAFQGETSADTMTAILREPPKSVRARRPDVGPEIERIIERCLEKKPESRFQSSHDLAFTLRSILADSGLVSSGSLPKGGQATAREVIPQARRIRRVMGLALPIMAAALVGLWLWWRQFATGHVATAAPLRSIAVLPFVNQSGNPGDEYFSDGMSDELASALMKVPGLRVAARSSAFSFKGKNADAREVGAKLDVGTVLEGAVRRSDSRLRITAQLVNTADGLVRWSERYEREAKDVFAVQDEITEAIVSALQLTLGSASPAAARVRTDNPEAHDLYLRGRFLAFKQTEEGLRKGLEYFKESLQKDPDYAPAYAGMAFAHGYLADAFLPPKEAQPMAKAAVLKALELDETNAEAHTYLALIRWLYDWEFEKTDAGFRRAIQLNPNSMEAHNFYAVTLCGMGRFDEGIAEVDRAIALDPLSAVPSWTREYCLVMSRRYDEAIAQHERTVELDPTFFYVDSKAALAYRGKGMPAESVAEYKRLQKVLGDLPFHGLAISYAKMGKTAEATEILQEFLDLSQRQYVSPEQIALIYAALGEFDQAFAWLDRAYDSRSAFMTSQILGSPDYDGLRSDPRFDDLLRRIGLSRWAR